MVLIGRTIYVEVRMYSFVFNGMYERATQKERLDALAAADPERLDLAKQGLDWRLEKRGLAAPMFFSGLLFTGQVAFFIWAYDKLDLPSSFAAIFMGLGAFFMVFGIVSLTGFIPVHRSDELLEALKREKELWVEEAAGRSEAQRSQVWDMWTGIRLSGFCTMLGLLVLVGAKVVAVFS